MLIGNLIDKTVDTFLGDSVAGEFVRGSAKVATGLLTGDLLTSALGAKDLFDGAAEVGSAALRCAPPVEFFGNVKDFLISPLGFTAEAVLDKLCQGYARPPAHREQLADAIGVVQRHFDMLDTAAGIGARDGILSRTDLGAALANPCLPQDLKQACRLLLDNRGAFDELDVAAGIGTRDGFVGRCDVDAMAARLAAEKTSAPKETQESKEAGKPATCNWDASYRGAVNALEKHFDVLDTAAGIGVRDGILARCDLEAALRNPCLPAELHEACRFLLANPAAFNELDVGSGIGKVDGFIARWDVEAVKKRLPAEKPEKTDKPDGTSGSGSDKGDDGKTGSSSGSKKSRFSGMSPEQIVESILMGLLNQFDDELTDTAKALEKAEQGKAAAKSGSSDEKKANADVNRLTFELQKLVEKRKQMFELVSNLSRVSHEMAKTAIGNLGRA